MKRTVFDPHSPIVTQAEHAASSGPAAQPAKSLRALVGLPEDVLLDVGTHLDAQSWLALRQSSKGSALQSALESTSVLRAVMDTQRLPPAIVDGLLSQSVNTSTAVEHLTAQAQLRSRLAKKEKQIVLRTTGGFVPRVSVHPDGLSFVCWCTKRFPSRGASTSSVLQHYDLSQRAETRPRAFDLRPIAQRETFPTDVAFAPDGRTLFVAMMNGSVVHLQRDAEGGFSGPQLLHQANEAQHEESRLLLSPSGKTLVLCRRASGDVDVVKTVDGTALFRGRPLAQRHGDHGQRQMATFLAENELLLVDQSNRLTHLTLHDDRPSEVRVVRGLVVENHDPFAERPTLRLMCDGVAERWLERRRAAAGGGTTIDVLDPSSLNPALTLHQGPTEKVTLFAGGHIEVRWTPGEGRGTVSVRDTRAGQPKQLQFSLLGNGRAEGEAFLSPDGSKLAVVQLAPYEIYLVELAAPELVAKRAMELAGPHGLNSRDTTVAFSPDSSLLVTLKGNSLHVNLA